MHYGEIGELDRYTYRKIPTKTKSDFEQKGISASWPVKVDTMRDFVFSGEVSEIITIIRAFVQAWLGSPRMRRPMRLQQEQLGQTFGKA